MVKFLRETREQYRNRLLATLDSATVRLIRAKRSRYMKYRTIKRGTAGRNYIADKLIAARAEFWEAWMDLPENKYNSNLKLGFSSWIKSFKEIL